MKHHPVLTFLLAGLILALMSASALMAEQTPAKPATKSADKSGKISDSKACCPSHQPSSGCCPSADKAKCGGSGKCTPGAGCAGKADACKDKANCAGKAEACKDKAKCCPTAKSAKKSPPSET
ncbi:MAG: hypothetical protein ABIK83_04725 [Candidatus Zixiibacteriota bacterium]